MAQERERIADERDRLAGERELLADLRDRPADHQPLRPTTWTPADGRAAIDERAPEPAGFVEAERDWAANKRDFVADDRQDRADAQEASADRRERSAHRTDERSFDDARAAAAAGRAAAGAARTIADRDRAAAATAQAHPLAAEFVRMARSLLRAETVELAMGDVVQAAVQFVNGCDAASFSAYVDDLVTTVASTGPLARAADDAQYRTSEGPCLEAIRTLQQVISGDLAHDERWPALGATAGHAVRSAVSSPVVDDDATSTYGTLNSYGTQPAAFDGEDADTAILLTAHLGVLLHLATTARAADRQAGQLSDAVESRDVIGQAKGILMERERLTAAQAFDVLRAASQRLNRKVREISEELADSGTISPR